MTTTATPEPLKWAETQAWMGMLANLLPEVFNKQISERLAKKKRAFIANDDLSWLTPFLPQQFKEVENLEYEVFKRLRSHYTHLVAYHGCRPLNIESYYELGIIPLDTASAHDNLVQRICNLHPTLTEMAVRTACTRTNAKNREGRIFFEASKDLLLQFCGHYLLYGSEYNVCVLRSMPSNIDFAQILRRQGKPTLLTCWVPIDWLNYGTQTELVRSLVATYYKKKLNPNYSHPNIGEGFGFEIEQTLPPELIVQVDYPAHIRDPIAH